MGTNYYVHVPPCPNACEHCGYETRIHLGKQSAGWRFLHRAYRGERRPAAVTWPVTDHASWLRLLDLGDIYDEYDRRQDRSEFLAFIDAAQTGIARDSSQAWELGGPWHSRRLSDFVS